MTIFGYIYFQKSNVQKNKSAFESTYSSLSPEELVNKYMQESALILKNQELKSIHEIKSTETESKSNQIKNTQTDPLDIPVEQQIAKDPSTISQTTLAEDFNRQSLQQQIQNIQSLEGKKQYAKEFMENARKNGYQITLSEDLQVTSIKQIRQPTNQQNNIELFESEPVD